MNLSEYHEYLVLTKKHYSFLTISKSIFDDVNNLLNDGKKICFLRHDIDFSIENAVRMARKEADENINSTYTVLLTGMFYNPFELENRKMLSEIVSLGHEVGLHFDPLIHNIRNEDELDEAISKEKSALEDIIQTKVDMFSFHNTTSFSMSCKKKSYAECINAYSDFFHNDVEYISDSHGYWRFRDWNTLLLENHKIIQVLTHPIWWQPDNSLLPLETVVRYMMDQYKNKITKYNEYFSGQNDRENMSYLSDQLKKINSINDNEILDKYVINESLMKIMLAKNVDEGEVTGLILDFLRK